MFKIYTHHLSRTEAELNCIVQYSRLSGLKSGLEKMGIQYEHQPQAGVAEGDDVLVISDHLMLRELIELKRGGLNFTLIAGPIFEIEQTHRAGGEQLMNVGGSPNPFAIMDRLDSVFSDIEVNAVLTAGDWAKSAWRFLVPSMGHKIYNWYAGVNTEYWNGIATPQKKRVLIYAKSNPSLVKQVEKGLKQLGFDVHVLQYGYYTKDEYRTQLSLCDFSVFISERETQGIALAESWAMDVPTFCWDICSATIAGLVLIPTSSCPYLTNQTGARWGSIDDLRKIIDFYDRKYFSPREWVLNNMSDKVSANMLLDTFKLFNK
jgi:hypothetical protein